MSSARYEPVNGSEDKPESSPPSSTTDARFTPSTDTELDGETFGGEDAFELHEVGKDGTHVRRESEDATTGAEESDDGIDERSLVGTRRTSIQSFELYTPDEERNVRKKLDTRLVLFVALLYMMAFLDRSNIGNAKLAGLTKDLQLSDDQFEWLLTAFYISYVAFEWTAICYKIFPPHIYISCCVCAWGFLASLQSLVTTYGPLVVLRALLGIGEAAFVGMPLYLSFFFRREELAFRTGVFVAAAPLATTFASTLAWLIIKFGSVVPIDNWRLLFLIEGFPACLVAVWAWWWIPDSPDQARWLTPRERKIATLRMRKETAVASKTGKINALEANVPRYKRKFNWSEVKQAIADPKAYFTAGMFFCCNVAFSSMPIFLPVILNSMGYSDITSQGLAALPSLFAFIIVLVTAFLSDRMQSRSIPMIFHALLAMGGYVFLAIAGVFEFGHTTRYLAVFPICAGFFSAVTIVITWNINNQVSDEGKGTAMAVVHTMGQLGPLLGTRLYPDSDGPYYVTGMSICAAAMGMVAILAFLLRVYVQRQNAGMRRRRLVAEGEGLVGGGTAEELMFVT